MCIACWGQHPSLRVRELSAHPQRKGGTTAQLTRPSPCRRRRRHRPPRRLPFWLQAGSVAGIAGLSFASFVGISYLEVRRKIEEQLQAGEDPYELKVDKKPQQQQRAQPPQKKASGGGKKKAGGGGGKRK